MAERLREGTLRQAEVLLRMAGGRSVILRLPGPAASGDDSEQLGLATPGFQDIDLEPAVFHRAADATKLLVSASAVLAQVKTLAYDSAEVLFNAAVGIVIEGVLHQITASRADQANGTPYCYWLTLQAPAQ